MISEILQTSKQKIAEICRRHQISELSLFGSQARGDFSEASDYDFLVEFFPDARIDYFELFKIQEELENLLDKRVDLVPKKGLRKLIRRQVLSEAEIVYAT